MADMRGTDVVIIGALAYLIWKTVNPEPLGAAGCTPMNIPTEAEPQSSIIGPAWSAPNVGLPDEQI